MPKKQPTFYITASMKTQLNIAIIQKKPKHLDLPTSLELLKSYLKEASTKGAELIVFGETWLTGYPAWLDSCPEVALWDNPAMKEVFAELYLNSVEVPGKEIQEICALAAELKVTICIGVNEIVKNGAGNGTIYNAVLIIGSDGTLKNHHRKLMPTFSEKLVYGIGDGHGLNSVDTDFGKLGSLICWEHWMPLTRQAMHESGETVHIALWPNVHERLQLASRSYAFEGRCFVIAVGQIMYQEDVPSQLTLNKDYIHKNGLLLNGGSCVIGPDGNFLLDPQFDTEDIIYYTIDDLGKTIGERMALDVTGHYNRKDVFDFKVNKERK
ncbi:carbon-nitrogen hydrolase family protein [Flammeovirgaceae bacterium SG7u.111]|nr:carbon-nitrogen hydrolase family protein [Flammeovirgaceae bacterium SG7u.132]WPO33392.1 carbon-nitrogen hydrolase family protein [Flammeovirgaceae bacterium SG7u.111]